MRRFLVYVVLLMHVNTYMFFPMVDETDVYEQPGQQKDDINSLAEYIYQILLGHRDSTPEDEDDDQAHFYQLKAPISYSITEQCQVPVKPERGYAWRPARVYGEDREMILFPVTHEIKSPPPDSYCV